MIADDPDGFEPTPPLTYRPTDQRPQRLLSLSDAVPTPPGEIHALLVLAGHLPPAEIDEHDSPLTRKCGCGWCHLKP